MQATVDGISAVFRPDPAEVAVRKAQESLFTPAVRRDIYAVLLNPTEPGVSPASLSPAATAAVAQGLIPYEVVLIAKVGETAGSRSGTPVHIGANKCGSVGPAVEYDTFAFVCRSDAQQLEAAGWSILGDDLVLNAVQHMGSANPLPLAATKAFEAFLSKCARKWTAQQISRLSVEFLIAFGKELTPRLGVAFRICTSILSDAEMTTLASAPFAAYVDRDLLSSFQQPPSLCTPPSQRQSTITSASVTPPDSSCAAPPSFQVLPDTDVLSRCSMPLPPLPSARATDPASASKTHFLFCASG